MLKPFMAWRRLKKSLALVLGFTLLTGCSYIATLDPNDNSRLEQLKLERQAEAAAANQEMTLPQLKQRVDGLRNAQYIFRTKIKEKVLVVETFSSLKEIQGAVEAAFSDTPSALEHLEFVNGVRGPEDQVPTSLLLEDPEGLRMIFSELAEWGPISWVNETYQNNRDQEVEEVYHLIRDLVLLKDQVATPLTKEKYQVRLLSPVGQQLALLTLSEKGQLQIELPDGQVNTYSLLNKAQFEALSGLLNKVIYNFLEDPEGESPEESEELPWLQLPYGEPNVVIGHEYMELSKEGDIKQEIITLEIGLVAYGDQVEEGKWLVGAPEEQLKINHYIFKRKDEAASWGVPSSELIDEEKAQEILDTWKTDEAPISEQLTLIREMAFHAFFNSVRENYYKLDPEVDWR